MPVEPALDPQYPHFSAAEMARRHRLVRALLEQKGLDGLIVAGSGRFQPDVYWISDWPGGREGYVVFPKDGAATLLVQFFNHVPTARRLAWIDDVRWAGPDDMATLAAVVREHGLSPDRLGFAGRLSFEAHARLAAELPGLRLQPLGQAYTALRLRRSEEEIERFRRAAALTDDAMERLALELRPGLPEEGIAAILEPPMLAAGGYAGIHYATAMPMDGPYVPVPAQYLGARRLQEGDVLITEVTGGYWGYQGQIHRTYSLGRPPDTTWRRLHDAARGAFAAILDVLRPGATAEAVMAAVEPLHEAGYLLYDDLLHGADQHPPVLRSLRTAHQPYPRGFTFEAGMVVVIQPNPYDPKTGMGLQFGETVVIREDGVERLHRYPGEWTVVVG